MAYVDAAAGIVAWNAVSKHATCGLSGMARRTRSRAARERGWWSGASGVSDRSLVSTPSSTSVAARYARPPCTTRWPTASTSPRSAMWRAISAGASDPTSVSSVRAPIACPSGSTTDSFSEDEPALTTRIRSTVTRPLARPRPVADLGQVLALEPRVVSRLQLLVDHQLPDVAGLRGNTGRAVDHVHDQVESIEVVEHDHVERRRRRAFLDEAPDVEVGVVLAAVGQAVDQPRVTVVGEDDRTARREQRVELRVGHPVRVLPG